MRRLLPTILLALAGVPAFAADVGVSVSVSQPGFYGRVDIGSFPQPQIVYAEPVVVYQPRVGVPMPRPIYLHVPPGHAKDWRKHCHKYNACGQPVYFVQENWYRQVYLPKYREREREHEKHHHRPPGKDKGKGKDKHHRN
jgi:hypothetical protein